MKKTLSNLYHQHVWSKKYGYHGSYRSWKAAQSNSSGYASENILKKISTSTQEVISGRAAFERDGATFEKSEYVWPLVSVILSATHMQKDLRLIDFGGSLGSTYFQHRSLFKSIYKTINWNVVEQKNFVALGNKEIASKELSFFKNLNDCPKPTPKILIISGSLGYIKNFKSIISQIISKKFDHIIIDRTVFVEGRNHLITIQKVPPSIYPASYPVRLFNYKKLLHVFSPDYKLKLEFPPYRYEQGKVEGREYQSKGFWLVKSRGAKK